ncbi:hypothetical protein BCR33DRAFT_767171 [Rhizoclosmatium globosum]|uniref:Uncharacterized protein n=1 Tax=Rhizoclosmatium globosum TaxID=329046 RepID=A0A1Y2C5I2_9FUNG|nr:hypothetical protein BCR33DRAFT_767171 [Rhizoclosmatium globosum]|eukprot:ORY42300.1 hypothetical protein BCR33DRAFT_767171 [Rhizoclosmatium globosum]
MSPDHFLLEAQSLFHPLSNPHRSRAALPADLARAFGGFKSSLRKYLGSKGMRGLDARRHFLRLSRRYGRQRVVSSPVIEPSVAHQSQQQLKDSFYTPDLKPAQPTFCDMLSTCTPHLDKVSWLWDINQNTNQTQGESMTRNWK